jgi:hypothetical protein
MTLESLKQVVRESIERGDSMLTFKVKGSTGNKKHPLFAGGPEGEVVRQSNGHITLLFKPRDLRDALRK